MILENGYRSRTAAGQALAVKLAHYANRENTLVLALPRGGVPVAQPIALALASPLDIFVVRKIGLPGQPELAIGAIATGGVQLLDDALIAAAKIQPKDLDAIIAKETRELARRETIYRGGEPPRTLAGQTIVLVDDGVATGYTMRVAILALRQLGPASLTVAIPVGSPESCEVIDALVDQLICPLRPDPFHAVGLAYDHFPPVSDDEVRQGISSAARAVARNPDQI